MRFAEELRIILTDPVYSFTVATESSIVRDVTEKRCYVGFDCDTDLETDELPDGNIIMREILIWPPDSSTLVSLSL